jgi:hypothetical protein
MASISITMSVKIKRRRINAMLQQCHGELKRAMRRDRPAIARRWLNRIKEKCIKVVL